MCLYNVVYNMRAEVRKAGGGVSDGGRLTCLTLSIYFPLL
jgi:hypothetical protein